MFFNAFMNYKTKRRAKKKYIDYQDVSNDDILILDDKDKIKIDDFENHFD